MPRAAEHMGWGAATGTGAGLLLAPRDDVGGYWAEVAGAALGGVIGGAAPDFIEPAISPNHRAVAHSGLAVAGLAFAARKAWSAKCREQAAVCRQRAEAWGRTAEQQQSDRLEELVWRVIAGLIIGFIAGYASHLALDSQTKMGLPLLGLAVR